MHCKGLNDYRTIGRPRCPQYPLLFKSPPNNHNNKIPIHTTQHCDSQTFGRSWESRLFLSVGRRIFIQFPRKDEYKSKIHKKQKRTLTFLCTLRAAFDHHSQFTHSLIESVIHYNSRHVFTILTLLSAVLFLFFLKHELLSLPYFRGVSSIQCLSLEKGKTVESQR